MTAFTVAHSITLIASAAGFAPDALWFPPLIEVLIAASIVYMALENIVGAKLERRWIVAFGFGLVHGFGFSFALRESLQFAGSHLATSLVSFNLGVELGQLAVLAVAVPALNWIFSHVVQERMGTIILSAFVAHTAWHWMLDRGAVLASYHIEMPDLDARVRRQRAARLDVRRVHRRGRLGRIRALRSADPRVAPGGGRREMTGRDQSRRWACALVVVSAAAAAGAGAQTKQPAATHSAASATHPAAADTAKVKGPSTLDGVYTDEQASRGKDVYLEQLPVLPHAGLAHGRDLQQIVARKASV